MKYIRLSRTLIARDGIMHSGTILPVEDANGMWKVKEGQFTGTLIPGYECEAVYTQQQYSEIYQELLQRREEVAELMKRLGQAETAADRAAEEVNRIANEIAEAREAKRVPLPRKVAEALELAKDWNVRSRDEKHEVVAWTIPTKKDGFWGVLNEFADEFGNFYLIIDALRYGYTIEDPHAEKRARLLENLAKIGYEGESAQTIVDTIAPIIFETESEKSG